MYPAVSLMNARFDDFTYTQAQCAVIGSNRTIPERTAADPYAKQICLSLAPYRACKSLTQSRSSANVSSFLPSHPEASLCRDWDRQPASSATDFPLPTATFVWVQKGKFRPISYVRCKRGHWKYTSCSRLNRHGRSHFGLLQGKDNLLLSESWLFHRHHIRSGEWLSYRNSVSEWSRILGYNKYIKKLLKM